MVYKNFNGGENAMYQQYLKTTFKIVKIFLIQKIRKIKKHKNNIFYHHILLKLNTLYF